MKQTYTTMVTAAAASWMLLAAPGCGSDSTNEPPNQDAATDTGSGADTGVDAGPVDRGPPPVPTDVVAAGVRWVGRVDTTTDAAHPRFSWSGTGFVAQFMGTTLTAQLKITGTTQIFKAVIDGVAQAPFTAAVGTNMFPIVAPGAGNHTVELYRQTEGPQGETQLMGLTSDGTMMDPPAGPGRLIEVIGDSITCGYGDLGMLSDTECYSTESHWDTYERVAAGMLKSEVSTIAASGRGVIRNYAGDTLFTMPMLYPQTLANPSLPVWDFHIEPQAVVINLGTNDISNNKGDPGDAFRDTYVQLLTTIRTNYPDAWIVAIIGPLLSGTDLTTIQGHIKDAVDMRTAAGDTKVEFFNMIQPQSSDKFACQYHPNVQENLIMATQLAGELSAKLGW